MRLFAFIFCIACAYAVSLQAFPLIIYNYAPPAPAFELASIVPANHQEMSGPPKSVTVGFSLVIDASQSSLKVFDQYNNPVAVSMKTPNPNGMELAMPPNLLAGVYRIEWNATCGCKAHNVISGTSYFTID